MKSFKAKSSIGKFLYWIPVEHQNYFDESKFLECAAETHGISLKVFCHP